MVKILIGWGNTRQYRANTAAARFHAQGGRGGDNETPKPEF